MFMVSYVFKAFFLFLEHMKQLFYILSFNILISVWCLSRPDSVVSAVCDLIHGFLYVVVFLLLLSCGFQTTVGTVWEFVSFCSCQAFGSTTARITLN